MYLHRPWIGLILLICTFANHAADFNVRTIEPERTFGYTIGDVLERRIQLFAKNNQLVLTELPQAQRYGRWVELQQAELTQNNQWLVLRFQIINAPSTLINTALPALSLATEQDRTINVEEWAFSMAPLIPIDAVNTVIMQPDRSPPTLDTAKPTRLLHWLLMCLFATLLAWLAWWQWLSRTDRKRLPFARSHYLLNKLPSTTSSDEPTWLLVHEAFDHTANRTISMGSIGVLIEQAPWLEPFKPQIEAFYLASSSRFFEPSSHSTHLDLRELCKQLCKAERNAQPPVAIKSDALNGTQ